MSLKNRIYLILVPLAALAIVLNVIGHENAANLIAPLLLILWGATGAMEYAKGEAIQVTWYRVSAKASRGERFLHLTLAIILIGVGVSVLFRHVF